MKKSQLVFTLIGLALIAGWFYWFQWRPTKYRATCYWAVHENAIGKPFEYFFNSYRICLYKHGINN